MKYKYHYARDRTMIAKKKAFKYRLNGEQYHETICYLCAREWGVNMSGYKLDTGCPKCRPELFIDYTVTTSQED